MGLFHFSFRAMACDNEIQLFAAHEAKARHAADAAIAEIKRIELKYSRYDENSVVSRINRSAGLAGVDIDDETSGLLDYADVCFRQSDGLFDITSGVLRRAWNFAGPRPPAPEQIVALLPLIGWRKIKRERHRVLLPLVGMELDFGGFGKEYAVDCAARVFQEHGIHAALVNLGGDLCALGPQPSGQAWGVGICHPRPASTGELLATLPLYSGAIASSGDYERFFEFEGRRYCHILDPRNGMPVAGMQAVTVHAPSCVVAGSATTIAMLKGEADGLAWLDALGLPYLCVRANGAILNTFNS